MAATILGAIGVGRNRRASARVNLSSPNPSFNGRSAWRKPTLSSAEQKSLTAAGFRVRHQDTDALRRLIQPWQTRSFAYYDILGEIKYAAQFYARMLSPLRLYAAELDDKGDWIEIDRSRTLSADQTAACDAIDRVQDPGGGREGLLASYGRLMFLTGEGILLCSHDAETDLEQWEFLSTDELRIQDGGVITRFKAPSLNAEELREPSDDDWGVVDGDNVVPYRLWKRHPRYSMWADSSMQGVLDLCEELVLLTQAVRARARSRLAGSGILFLDSRISEEPAETAPDEDPAEDVYLNRLTTAMMAPIGDEGDAGAIVPLVSRVEVPDGMKMADLVYHLQIVDPMQVYPETGLRIECIHRIAIGLDMPPEELEGKSDANHWCQSDDTEILARGRGWISNADLSVGDEVYTLNHEDGVGEWQAVDSIYRAPVENEVMYALESRSHSSLSTPAHRWPIVKTGYKVSGSRRRWTTSAEGFAQADRVPLAAKLESGAASTKHEDDLVRLVVAFTADGTELKHDNVRIAKFSDGEIVEMRRILTSLFGDGGFREHEHKTSTADGLAFVLRQAEARQVLALCGDEKAIGLAFVEELTSEQRLLMLRSCVEIGDGVEVDGAVTLYQVEEERLEAFAYAAHLSGLKVTYGKRSGQTGYGTEPLSWIRWSAANDSFAPASCEQSLVAYNGVVWCPSTPNRTWLARRNGRAYFTGNTVWNIDEQTWKAHGMPIANQLVSDLTGSYFRPTLKSDGVADPTRFAIRYDPTKVINHPDRGKDAIDLFDRVALSKEALRDAKGFAEDDAPSEEERAERVGILTRDSSLAWDGTPAPRGGAVETAPGVIEQAVPGDGGEQRSTGSSAEPGPPAEPTQPVAESVVGSSNGNGGGSAGEVRLHRILGAADLALLRAREAAGNRLKSLARRNPDLAELIEGLPAREVAAALGPDRVRDLKVTETDLVSSASGLILDALRLWQVDPDAGALIAEQLQLHAARTLYERTPPPLPRTFSSYVQGILRGVEKA